MRPNAICIRAHFEGDSSESTSFCAPMSTHESSSSSVCAPMLFALGLISKVTPVNQLRFAPQCNAFIGTHFEGEPDGLSFGIRPNVILGRIPKENRMGFPSEYALMKICIRAYSEGKPKSFEHFAFDVTDMWFHRLLNLLTFQFKTAFIKFRTNTDFRNWFCTNSSKCILRLRRYGTYNKFYNNLN